MPRQLGPIKRMETAPQLLFNLLFEGHARRPAFPESRGNYDRRFGARIHALANELRNRRRRRGDHGQVHRPRDVANARYKL